MNPRERLLAIVVGVLLLAILGFMTQSFFAGQFATRAAEVSKLESDIQRFKRQVQLGQRAMRKVTEYEARSLPPSPELTRTNYQNWLLSEIEELGMREPEVNFAAATNQGDLYVMQSFNVSALGTLPQVVDLLHSFYSVDWLHRIANLSLVPVKDTKLLTLTMKVEAVSVKSAKETAQLEPRPGNRLALPDRQAYYDAIVARNLFGPANQPPGIAVSGAKDVFLGRSAELSIKGTDPDPLDKVQYELVQSAAPEARFDPASGRFSWSPQKTGQYEFLFQALDDGFPRLASRAEKVVVNVMEQPPPAPPRLDFDHARYTVLTAVLDIDGQGEIWLHVRPTGNLVKLHRGDQFEIGSVKGTVAEIGESHFAFDFEGKRRQLSIEQSLDKSQVVQDLTQAAPAAPPPAPPAAAPAAAPTVTAKTNSGT